VVNLGETRKSVNEGRGLSAGKCVSMWAGAGYARGVSSGGGDSVGAGWPDKTGTGRGEGVGGGSTEYNGYSGGRGSGNGTTGSRWRYLIEATGGKR
jgi:hypothetical protein